MPNTKSPKKRMRSSAKARLRNRAHRSVLRSVVKDVRTETTKEAAEQKLAEAVSMLDKSASRGLIHRKTASRNRSRLTKLVAKLS